MHSNSAPSPLEGITVWQVGMGRVLCFQESWALKRERERQRSPQLKGTQSLLLLGFRVSL